MVRFEDSVMYVTRHDVVSVTHATVQVSNLPASFKQDTLRMLLEDTKQSGGGPIDNIEYDIDTGRALVAFKDSAGMSQHVLSSLRRVQQFNTTTTTDNFSASVKLAYFSRDTPGYARSPHSSYKEEPLELLM